MILDGSHDMVVKFYNVFLKSRQRRLKRTLILCAPDVDGLCALKILLRLFSCDLVDYTLVMVSNAEEMESAMKLHRETIRNVITIGCGAVLPLHQVLGITDDQDHTKIFVLDSRRPIHEENLYSEHNVMVLTDKFDVKEIPSHDDVIAIPEDFWVYETLQEGEDPGKRKARVPRKVRDRWLERREKILAQYHRNVWHERSVALKMFELAHSLSKDDSELLFWALCGLCHLVTQRKIMKTEFISESAALQGHVIRLLHSVDSARQGALRINYTRDLALCFYRQWTILESIQHTPYTAVQLWTWEKKATQHLLADMGLSLKESGQSYQAMDATVRSSLLDWFQEKIDQHNVPDLIQPAFILSHSFNQKIQICDMSLGLFAALTIVSPDQSPQDNFHYALELLEARDRSRLLPVCLELGRHQLEALWNVVKTALQERLFAGVQGAFFQASLEGLASSVIGQRFLANPQVLLPLAHLLQRCYVAYQKGKRIRELPFLLFADILEQGQPTQHLHVVGLPALEPETCRSDMGAWLSFAAKQAGIDVYNDSFESHLLRIAKISKPRFLECLVGFRERFRMMTSGPPPPLRTQNEERSDDQRKTKRRRLRTSSEEDRVEGTLLEV